MSASICPPARPAPRRGRAGFALTLAGLLLMMAGASAPSPFYPVLQQEIGFSSAAMTGIFAIYAGALLATLLVAGSVSDHLGRRPVLSVGFFLLAASMVGFLRADTVGALLITRVIQGMASGLLLSTLTATSTDLEPADRPGAAAVGNSVTPLLGLALGALFAGAVIEDLPAPRGPTFEILAAAYAALAALVWLPPETAPRHEGLIASLRPRIGVPQGARAAFRRGAPAIVASWATGGLYLSLGAPIVARVFGQTDAVAQGAVVTLLSGAGALAAFALRRQTPRRITLTGTAALSLGTLLTLAAIASGSFAFYALSVLVAGLGFGASFYGVMRSIAPTVGAGERGELFAALFTLSYTAFGLPALAAGIAMPQLGLTLTTYLYGAVIIVLAGGAGLARRFTTTD
ncbi:MFS transporter [Acidimangrovimonas sediminis]|uniref:MFS transporter n=1 Tax=Acidimangrovimonas sediminis TaxID=2056283 RepID=UPI000C7F9157|nr:MFS transporter [Acidimangrovimonas sediminis]